MRRWWARFVCPPDERVESDRSALGPLAAAAALQELLDPIGLVADRLDGFLQLVLADAEFLRPVAQFVVLVHVDALAIGSAAVLEVVGHVGLQWLRDPRKRQAACPK